MNLLCMKKPSEFIFSPSAVFKQGIIFKDQRVLKIKVSGYGIITAII